jgi:hypothetical protein
MKLESAIFARLRRLAPVLDDVLSAGEVEHADQAVDLAFRLHSSAHSCSTCTTTSTRSRLPKRAMTPLSRSNTRYLWTG